jgi:hypothetical protein
MTSPLLVQLAGEPYKRKAEQSQNIFKGIEQGVGAAVVSADKSRYDSQMMAEKAKSDSQMEDLLSSGFDGVKHAYEEEGLTLPEGMRSFVDKDGLVSLYDNLLNYKKDREKKIKPEDPDQEKVNNYATLLIKAYQDGNAAEIAKLESTIPPNLLPKVYAGIDKSRAYQEYTIKNKPPTEFVKEKSDQATLFKIANEVSAFGSEITKIKKSKSFQAYEAATQGLKIIDEARKTKDPITGKPVNPSEMAVQALYKIMPRVLGEVGNLAEWEQKTSVDPIKWRTRISNFFKKGLEGTLDASVLNDIEGLLKVIQNNHAQGIGNNITDQINIAKTAYKKFPDIIEGIDEIAKGLEVGDDIEYRGKISKEQREEMVAILDRQIAELSARGISEGMTAKQAQAILQKGGQPKPIKSSKSSKTSSETPLFGDVPEPAKVDQGLFELF